VRGSVTTDTIVIAVDGSPASDEATGVGLEIAAGAGGRVTFVHGNPHLSREFFDEDARNVESQQERIDADPVLRAAASSAEERGVAYDVELVGVSAADELVPAILGVAAALGARMIVVGSRGRGALASVALGTVSHGLVDAATVPIVVVHAPHRP
jgi:nucleotide-binding universal stress UspA family protein